MFQKYISVILDLSLDKPLDYGVPDAWLDAVAKGKRVEVPVKGKPQKGFIFELKNESSIPSVRPLLKVLSETELIPEELFDLALWMSRYYSAPLSHTLRTIIPSSVRKAKKIKQQLSVMRAKTREELAAACQMLRQKHPAQAAVLDEMLKVRKEIFLSELLEKTGGTRSPVDTLAKKGFLKLDIVRVDRSPFTAEEYFRTKPKMLKPDQKNAFDKILPALEAHRFETHLLFGITGSGKTEIYLQSIEKALDLGKGAIVLIPEISLTAQTIERFRGRFHEKIAILHHRLSDGERFETWNDIREGGARIVIGARSAIFSPVKNLGLIIVDEEHEHSYKNSEEMPCYHARDVAVMRGNLHQAVVILGSATPSLESFHNAETGKYLLSKLESRAESQAKPLVKIIDMKRECEKAKGYTHFSEDLLEGIKERHERGEQTILFLNRRGYHTTLFCQECREALKCAHCDRALTYHFKESALSCHLCGFSLSPPPRECPKCRASCMMKYKGVGTELLESSLKAILPMIRTLRIDADTTRHKGSHQRLLREFGTGKADVLIGTQMIAKGLHFSEVTLVGVVNCDMGLNIPDFKASETAFQLMTQVAGRSGRGAVAGEVIFQTYMPENSTIVHAAAQDYEAFYREEMASREIFHYPPFFNLINIRFSGKDERQTLAFARQFQKALLQLSGNVMNVHAVTPSTHVKIKDLYRFQLLLCGKQIYAMNRCIAGARALAPPPHSIKILVDVNPVNLL